MGAGLLLGEAAIAEEVSGVVLETFERRDGLSWAPIKIISKAVFSKLFNHFANHINLFTYGKLRGLDDHYGPPLLWLRWIPHALQSIEWERKS